MSKNKRWQFLSTVGLMAIVPPMAVLCTACGGGGGSSTASPLVAAPAAASTTVPTAAPSSSAYAAAYKSAKWSAEVTVSFSDACTMSLTTTGVPPYHADYYLGPAGPGGASVAVTP